MTKYKIHVSFDGINYFWIVVDREIFIRNPTEEDLKYATEKSYNNTNICSICREKNNITDNSILYPKNAYKEYIKENWTKRWTCSRCHAKFGTYGQYEKPKRYYNPTHTCDRCGKSFNDIENGGPLREYDENRGWTKRWDCPNCWQKYDPNSTNNIIKSMSDRRIGLLKDPTKIFGDNCEELTHRWLGAKDLNEENDNYNSPLDHGPIRHITVTINNKSVDLYGKIPQTKGRHYDPIRKCWSQTVYAEHDKEFDILILYCVSEDGKKIERIYIIPKEEIIKVTSISIYISKWSRISKIPYGQYRVKDGKILSQQNME